MVALSLTFDQMREKSPSSTRYCWLTFIFLSCKYICRYRDAFGRVPTVFLKAGSRYNRISLKNPKSAKTFRTLPRKWFWVESQKCGVIWSKCLRLYSHCPNCSIHVVAVIRWSAMIKYRNYDQRGVLTICARCTNVNKHLCTFKAASPKPTILIIPGLWTVNAVNMR